MRVSFGVGQCAPSGEFMDFEAARAQFPALEQKTFLDAACVSIAPVAVTNAIKDFLQLAEQCPARSATLHHISMDGMRAAARPAIGRLINADEDEIALVESTSHGLTIAAQAIPLSTGDRVLLCDLEFMEVALPWIQLKPRGIEIDVVRTRGGRFSAEDFAASLTPNTKVIAISSVQWSNGFRCNLDAISALAAEHDLWLVVDAIQQLGAIPLDVKKTRVDLLSCGGHKWLNSPFGTGFLYIRRGAWPKLQRPMSGYISVQPPVDGWGAHFQNPAIQPVMDYKFVESAAGFEVGGTSNYVGAIALAASLKLIQQLGESRIAERVCQLTDHLIAGLNTIGVDLVTPPEREHRAGIVTFSVGSPEENTTLMDKLLAQKILVSVRYTSKVGGVRVSCHYFNNDADIDRLLETVESAVPHVARVSK